MLCTRRRRRHPRQVARHHRRPPRPSGIHGLAREPAAELAVDQRSHAVPALEGPGEDFAAPVTHQQGDRLNVELSVDQEARSALQAPIYEVFADRRARRGVETGGQVVGADAQRPLDALDRQARLEEVLADQHEDRLEDRAFALTAPRRALSTVMPKVSSSSRLTNNWTWARSPRANSSAKASFLHNRYSGMKLQTPLLRDMAKERAAARLRFLTPQGWTSIASGFNPWRRPGHGLKSEAIRDRPYGTKKAQSG